MIDTQIIIDVVAREIPKIILFGFAFLSGYLFGQVSIEKRFAKRTNEEVNVPRR